MEKGDVFGALEPPQNHESAEQFLRQIEVVRGDTEGSTKRLQGMAPRLSSFLKLQVKDSATQQPLGLSWFLTEKVLTLNWALHKKPQTNRK